MSKAKSRSFIFLVSLTGLAAGVYNDNHEKRFSSAIVRSSRAIYTIGSSVVDYKYSTRNDEVHGRIAKRILALCETNKGFYIKAAQFATSSAFGGQLPKEYAQTLSHLQDHALPSPFRSIRGVLSAAFGPDLSKIFMSFNEHPIAAASIAQVHHAVLIDGTEVAVKVQYPGLEQQMLLDTATMSFISKSLSWLFPDYRFHWLVHEFKKSIASELDFIQEATNSEKTAKNFRHNNVVKVPRVFWDFTTNQVLTMEYFRGHKVDDVEFLKKNKIDPAEVVKELVKMFAEMIFVFGFLHGDLHPGNILVSPQGPKGFSIVLLDHGIYRELDENFRLNYCKLWKALILSDTKKIQYLGEQFGVGKYSRYIPVMFTGRTIDSKLPLGRGMSLEERNNLKKDLKLVKMEDISSFMESLPPDFLAILRTDGLLRSMINKLGASRKLMMMGYAKYALYGLSLNLNPEYDGHGRVKVYVSRLKAKMSLIEVRIVLVVLEWLYWTEERREAIVRRFGRMIVSLFALFQPSTNLRA